MAGFVPLIVGLCLLVGGHLGLSSRWVRPRLVAAIGLDRYRGVYSVVAVLGLGVSVWGYSTSPYELLWETPDWAWLVPLLLMPVAIFLIVAGYSQTNPLAIGQERAMEAPDAGAGVLAITRHPVMWGTALAAVAHLPPNGDVASVVLFAAVAVLALGGALHQDRRRRAEGGEAWVRFAGLTSFVPFWGVITRKTHIAFKEIGAWRVLLALAAVLILLWLHPLVIGVSPLPPAAW